MMSVLDAGNVAQLRKWRDDPVAFCQDVFRLTLDPWQVDALQELPNRDRVAFIASKGVGKSFLEAVAGWWWMVTRKRAQVICTSINAKNLRDGLWKEIGGLYGQSKLLQAIFQFNSERAFAKEDPTSWFMSARSWRDHADAVEQAQALAGLHGPAMLWLGDEAGSYHEAILASGSAMMANAVAGSGNEAKMLLGGNPTDPKGPLGKISRNRESWHVVTINGDPDNPKRSTRISADWCREQIKNYGRDNAWVKVSVFGEFPDVGFTNLLGPADIDRSRLRNYLPEQYQLAQKRLGVDVARFGDDATVIYCRQGLKAGPYLELRKVDTQAVADRVALAMQKTKAEIAFVDQTGMGAGVVDALRRLRVRVIGVDGSQSPTDERYFNKRAEEWCEMARWVKEGGQIPDSDTALHDDLMAPTYTFKGARTIIEPKDDIKARLGRSPDHGDALALTFSMIDMPAADPLGLGYAHPLMNQSSRKNSDFDPHSTGADAGRDWNPFGGGL
jgi:hypothetical protein